MNHQEQTNQFCLRKQLQFQVKQTDAKQTKQGEIESKGTVAPGGSIQVVQKGEKEVLTLRKPPNNAVVNTYKPDIKAKADDATSTDKRMKPDASVKQTQITPANRTGGAGIKASDVSAYGQPPICIGENKAADQLRGIREADQRLCFRYTDSTIPLLLKYKISSL